MEQRNMCTMKCLITKINNSVIHIYYMFFPLYSTCTMSIINGPITLLNYMLIYLISPSNFVQCLQVNTTSLLVLSWYK